jgi:hypothetical protein
MILQSSKLPSQARQLAPQFKLQQLLLSEPQPVWHALLVVVVDNVLACGDNVVVLDGQVQPAARQELANTRTSVRNILSCTHTN